MASKMYISELLNSPPPVYQVVVQGAEHMPYLSELCSTA